MRKQSINEIPPGHYLPTDADKTEWDNKLDAAGGSMSGNLGIGKTSPLFGIHQLGGGYKLEALVTPAAPIVSTVGAKGTAAVAEVASLDVTGICTTAGDVTVTLNGISFLVSLVTTDNTTDLVASKIRGATYTGWTTGGTLSNVTFTKDIAGEAVDATYSEGTTGATGTIGTTTQGKNDTRTLYEYFIVAEDRNGGKTMVSASGSVTDGNPVLDATNYNTISWTAIDGAIKYYVLKGNTSTLLGTVTTTNLNDQGQATSAFTAPTRNTTADLVIDGKILSQTIDKVGSKTIDETAIGDDKILVYKTASGTIVYEDKPTGGASSSETSSFQAVTWDTTTTITLPTGITQHKVIITIPSGSAIASSTFALSGMTNGAIINISIINNDTVTKTITLPTGSKVGTFLTHPIKLPASTTLDMSVKNDGVNNTWNYTLTKTI